MKAQTDVWITVDDYLSERLVLQDEALLAAVEASATAGLPPIQVTACQGKLLQLMAQMLKAKRILEVGTLGGYSTIWLARALPENGRLITLEINSAYAEVARNNLARAKLLDLVELRVGPARDSLRQFIAENTAPFDLIFIDADKVSTLGYFHSALQLSRPGTVIIVDNVIRNGAIVEEDNSDEAIHGMRQFLDYVRHEKKVSATAIQTVGAKGYDGFAVALVR